MGCSEKKSACECPEKLTGKPEECASEQIRECHGSKKEHPCLPKERQGKAKRKKTA